MADLFHQGFVTARTDIPKRTDIDAPVPYRQNKHVLFGQQEGRCNGCCSEFPFRNFTIDHIVPESRGGTDHIENLQLLCGHCNSVKGRPAAGVPGGQASRIGNSGMSYLIPGESQHYEYRGNNRKVACENCRYGVTERGTLWCKKDIPPRRTQKRWWCAGHHAIQSGDAVLVQLIGGGLRMAVRARWPESCSKNRFSGPTGVGAKVQAGRSPVLVESDQLDEPALDALRLGG